MTDTGFKPYAMEVIGEDYMSKDDLHRVYGEAWNLGLFIKEFGPSPTGYSMSACGSVHKLQEIEHDNPEIGDIDIQGLSLGECMGISAPGGGETREEACREAIRVFTTDPAFAELYAEHLRWREEATA